MYVGLSLFFLLWVSAWNKRLTDGLTDWLIDWFRKLLCGQYIHQICESYIYHSVSELWRLQIWPPWSRAPYDMTWNLPTLVCTFMEFWRLLRVVYKREFLLPRSKNGKISNGSPMPDIEQSSMVNTFVLDFLDLALFYYNNDSFYAIIETNE